MKLQMSDIFDKFDNHVIVIDDMGNELENSIKNHGDVGFGILIYEVLKIDATKKGVLTITVKSEEPMAFPFVSGLTIKAREM